MKTLSLLLFIIVSFSISAQQSTDQNTAQKIDDLATSWDEEARELRKYKGLKKYCSTKFYRDKMINLLDDIHHYDTLLYGIVTRKFQIDQDEEAKETLVDIEKLEMDYTTRNFKAFIHRECNGVNTIERTYGRKGGGVYSREVKKLERELRRYVESITLRIDVINDHVHHLKLL